MSDPILLTLDDVERGFLTFSGKYVMMLNMVKKLDNTWFYFTDSVWRRQDGSAGYSEPHPLDIVCRISEQVA